jgi:nucleoside-diphosphate-sugar epimerase
MTEPALITGAAGFVGTHLARTLRGLGIPVRGLVRPDREASHLEAMGVTVVRGDATERRSLEQAAHGCGTVFDLAAARGRHKLSRRTYLELNARGAEAVGQAVLAVGARRLVFASTVTVCGGARAELRDETTPVRPNSGYRESKFRAEQVFRRLQEDRGLPVVIARLPQMLGPGALEWRTRFRAVRDGRIRFLPRGGINHPGDVTDMVDGLRLCADVPGIEGGCFMLAGPDPVTVRDLYGAIARALGAPFSPRDLPAGPFLTYAALANFAYRAAALNLPHGYTCEVLAGRIGYNIGKARRVLGFAPRFSVAESVARTAAWMVEHRIL